MCGARATWYRLRAAPSLAPPAGEMAFQEGDASKRAAVTLASSHVQAVPQKGANPCLPVIQHHWSSRQGTMLGAELPKLQPALAPKELSGIELTGRLLWRPVQGSA